MTVRMEPAFDTRAFRHALGHFPTGVCVVTARVDDAFIGMTVNSFNSLSLAPPLVLFSVDAGAASLPLAAGRGVCRQCAGGESEGHVRPLRQVRRQ